MENFFHIDWNPPLEDVICTNFVDMDRFKKESVVYRMLKGQLSDPFADMHEEQECLVTSEMMARVELESDKHDRVTEPSNESVTSTETSAETLVPRRRNYVPGISKNNVWFPRLSSLNSEQQALCLRILLKFYGSERPEMSSTDKHELQTYLKLVPLIAQEQQEFLEFVKTNWDPSEFAILEEGFITEQWKKKLRRVQGLPRYYTQAGNIPLVSPKEIAVCYSSPCLELGILPITILPTLTRRVVLPLAITKINQRFFSEEAISGSRKSVIFKTPVSRDPNCHILAEKHDVDLVVSSGGLNCLAVNIDPGNTTSWILPIVVKCVNKKNVVFIDKPLPPTGLTVLQKNAWLCKYRLKSYVNHPYHIKAISLDEEADEEVTQLRISRNLSTSNVENNFNESTGAKDTTRKTDENQLDQVEDFDNSKEHDRPFSRPPIGHNLFYRLYSMGPCGEHQSELLKNRVEREYKLLVRTKADGAIRTPNGDPQLIMVAPKLEHQLNFGAEAVTLEEAAKQWMALTFRPDTYLARVRVDSKTSEVIQIETRTPMSINNEVKRLYNLKTEAAVTLLHNVAETFTGMIPGRYLLRRSVRSGPFADIYKEAEGPGKNVFDLQTIYWENEFTTIANPPWPVIDKGVITPSMKYFNRMPAMYRTARMLDSGNKKTKGKKNKRRYTDTNAARKSSRNK